MHASRSTLLILLALLLAVGCSPRRSTFGGGGGNDDDDAANDDDASWDDDDVDSDGDGLGDNFEEWLDTDPQDEDSDGDGYDDGDEYLSYFLPTDSADFPYVGGYPRGPFRDDLDGEGWSEGDITDNWTADDRWGQELHLHRFYGNVVVIEMAAEWCGPCRAAAEGLEDEYQDRKDDGFVVIQLLIDGLDFDSPPDPDRWANDFDLTLPVLDDGQMNVSQHYAPTGSFGIPNFTVLDRELVIQDWFQEGGNINWSLVDSLLDEPAPEVDWPIP